jgi:hypothetical protein
MMNFRQIDAIRWHVEFYGPDVVMFPYGLRRGGKSAGPVDFILVGDEWRRQGIAT